MDEPRRAYLDDPTFDEPPAGPLMRGQYNREPSLEQIRARCLAIQKTWDQAEEYIRRICPHLEEREAARLRDRSQLPTMDTRPSSGGLLGGD